MSDSETPTAPSEGSTAQAEPSKSEAPTTEAPAPAIAAAPPAADGNAAGAAPSFEELRRKLLEQITGIGDQVDSIQGKLAADLAQAASQARAVIEKEIAQVKDQHPDAFARLHELRDVGEEGWGVLRTRLDRLAGDLEKALGGFLTSVTDAVKRVPDGASPSASVAGADAAASTPPTDSAAASTAPSSEPTATAADPAVAAPSSDDKSAS